MKIQLYLVGILALWNLIVFVLYGMDKRRAIRQEWRIPEKTLILTAFFGAGLGAFLAGRVFHHKTRKWYFQVVWYLGMAVDVGLLYLIWRM